MRRVEGSVSVFLALTITIMLSFCMVLIESARENTMLLKADIVFDTGVQSLLAEYHRILWEEYDLLYVDCSYGQATPNYDLTKAHLKSYVEKNLQYDMGSWLDLSYEGAALGEVLLATDNGGTDFYLQAVSAAEAAAGIPYIEKVLEWLGQVESTYSLRSVISEEKLEATATIEEANGTEVEVKEAVWGTDKEGNPILLEDAEYETIDIENPLEQILSANVLLRQVTDDYSAISNVGADLSALASHRTLAEGTIDTEKDADGLWNKVLFCKYVFEHFKSYADERNGEKNHLSCEVEYILGGKGSDSQNLEMVVAELLVIREIDNYLCLLQDEIKMAEAYSVAAAAAGIAPWLEPVVYQAMLLYWAYEDSVEDLQVLFRGGKVPLVKALPLDQASQVSLDYEEYLWILLLLQNREKLTFRTMDLIELDIREEQSVFRMDACISEAVLAGIFTDKYDKRYTITKKLQYY